MKRKTIIIIGMLILFVFLIYGCTTEPVEVTTETAGIQAESVTQIPTETPEPSPTATQQPTEIPAIPCTIAFDSDRDNNKEIYVMGTLGENPTNLTNNSGDDIDPVWSPDGKKIAFVSNRENGEEEGQFIYTMNADGSDVVQLTHETQSNYPDWSNDGKIITYTDHGDIYIIKADGSGESINLTNSAELDEHSSFSPDSNRILWLSGTEGNRNIFLMNVDGSNIQQITFDGKVNDAVWTINGEIFAHWDNQEVRCFNCVMAADGSNIRDAGGKGSIQEFLPFWTEDGKRVEMVSTDLDTGSDEIYLVGEVFPDIFLNLTNSPGNDQNPDAPANCGPVNAADQESSTVQQSSEFPVMQEIVIGYTGIDESNDTGRNKLAQLQQACNELGIECVRGNSIDDLSGQDVDAILAISNRWSVLGDYPAIHNARENGKLVIILDAETGEQGAYNLSIESDYITKTLDWMFSGMGGKGDFVYYNYGGNGGHEEYINRTLENYPDIHATAMPASYQEESITEQGIMEMIASDPNLGAIWSDEDLPRLFWGVSAAQDDHYPRIPCITRLEELTSWQQFVAEEPTFQCISAIEPAGTAYEGVYVAYYILSGLQINPEALGGIYGNTFMYEYPLITNDNLDAWIDKSEGLIVGDGGFLKFPAMGPEEIKQRWFIE